MTSAPTPSYLSGIERTAAEFRLADVLDAHRDEITGAWLAEVGENARVRFPDLDRYLRSLLSGLAQVFREGDWSLTQTIIDGLAERRARIGINLEHGMQRAVLAGRHAIRAYCPDDSDCHEVFLEALHECVFRFAESYQGIRISSESDRLHTRIIKSLVMALEARDPYTKGHSTCVALVSQKVAELIGNHMDPTSAYLAGLLHDVGKVGIPDSVLLKSTALSSEEWDLIRAHPVTGANILKPINLEPDVISGVLSHHENYDGSGYPRGLARDEIPPIARLLRITDSYDAMTSTRAYRSSQSADAALDELIQEAGHLYDPDALEAFVSMMRSPGMVRELSMASLQIDLSDSLSGAAR